MKKYIPILSMFCFFFFVQAEKAHFVIAAIPAALFTVSDTNICVGESITFTDQSTGIPTSWSWQFSGGFPASDTVQNPTVTYDSTGAYNVTLIVSNIDGSDTLIKIGYITVNAPSAADFNIITDTFGCHPLSVSFTNLSTGADNYSWNFGDGFPIDTSSADTIVHQYTNVSTSPVLYNSCLIAQNQAGCADTLCKLIFVYPDAPSIIFFADQDSGCSPLTVKFTTFVTGSIDTCLYDFGDGDTAIHCGPTHTFTSVSDTFYTVAISGINPWGCLTDTFTTGIFVHPKPVINSFTVTPSIGCPPICATISGTATGASAYFWDFGDATFDSSTTDTTFIHCYINTTSSPQFYTLNLIVKNNDGCSDTASTTITVLPDVTAIFSPQPDTAGCHPYTVNFQNISTGAAIYEWDFGNGNTSTLFEPSETFLNPSVTFHDSVYTVQLIATSIFPICEDTATREIVVHPKPMANFTVDTDTGCNCFTVTITNLSIGWDNVFWYFGDGDTSMLTLDTITHTYCNFTDSLIVYPLELIVNNSDGCSSDTLVKSIVVLPEVTAAFAINMGDTIGCHPYTVDFVNLSTGADTYLWDFGDGNTDTTFEPSYTFYNFDSTTVVYTVTLIATFSFPLCKDTALQDIYVLPMPAADFIATPDTQTLPNSTVTITNNSTVGPGSVFLWDFGDGNISILQNPGSHTYSFDSSGTYMITLTITSSICSDIDTQYVTLLPITGIEQNLHSANSLNLYPNPASNSVIIGYKLPEDSKNVFINIYNIFGQKIKTFKVVDDRGKQYLDISEMSNGLYSFTVVYNNKTIVRNKLMIIR